MGKEESSLPQCREQVESGYRYTQCSRKATTADGYCSQHALNHGDHETTTWYRVSTGAWADPTPTPVQVIKATAQQLVLAGGSRCAKKDRYTTHFATLGEATHYVHTLLQGRVSKAEAALDEAANRLKAFEKEQSTVPPCERSDGGAEG